MAIAIHEFKMANPTWNVFNAFSWINKLIPGHIKLGFSGFLRFWLRILTYHFTSQLFWEELLERSPVWRSLTMDLHLKRTVEDEDRKLTRKKLPTDWQQWRQVVINFSENILKRTIGEKVTGEGHWRRQLSMPTSCFLYWKW